MTKDELKTLVDNTALQLGEHCDSVRIFVTRSTEDGERNTMQIDSGCGNFYAQLGQIHEWVSIQDQYQRNWANRQDDRIYPKE